VTVRASHATWAGPDSVGSGPDANLARLRLVLSAQRDLACADEDAGTVFDLLADSVLSIFPAEGVLAAEPQGGRIVARASVGTCGPPVGTQIPQAGTLAGLALSTLEPQLCHDSRTDPRTPSDINEDVGARSSVIVPLVHDGVAIGLVAALSSVPCAFTEDDLALLVPLADVAASSLRRTVLRGQRESLAARTTAIVEVLTEGLVELDTEGRITFANLGAQRMLGFTWDQVSGTAVQGVPYSFVYEDGTERPTETLPGFFALRTGEAQQGEIVGITRADGQRWWLLANAAPRRDAHGVCGVVTSFTDITRRLEMEESGQRHVARLHAAQELTGLAWWSLDVATGRHEWSDAMFRLVGLEPSDVAPTGDEFLRLVHPDDLAAARSLADSGFVTGHGEVFRVVHPDGSVRFLQSWTDIDRDDDGAALRVVGATIDVTQREDALASLEVSQANLQAALELTRTATWEWDVLRDRITWSERMTELMGWPAESRAAPGVEDFLSCLHPEDRDRMRELGERTVETALGEEAVYRVLLRSGETRHVRAWTDVRTDPAGRVVALWGTAMDVTEQVEHATRLAASEEHFRVAFDNAPIGMSMISLRPETAGRYLRANKAFEDMVGYERDDLVGRQILDLTHPADWERDANLFSRLADGVAQTVAFEKRYRRRDGDTVQAWLTSSVVHDGDGTPLYLVTHAVDITDRLREQAELERLALTDTLTGLANRTLLDDRIDQALARLQRAGGVCGMLLLDVDRFKTVNDSLGHQVGDALLVEIAGRLEAVTRAGSTVARLGGDEFVVLVEDLREPDEIHAIAARLLEALRRPYALGPNAESLVATVSLGISVATSAERSHIDLYREADLALYRAKDGGRDQYALFDDALRARADARLESETLLRRALAENRLVALLQPLVDLSDGRIHAAEGLARVETEDGGLVPPSEFIDVAEETGLIVEVDARMFEQVVAAYAALNAAEGVGLRRVSSNVSARSLEDPTFVDRMSRALSWYGVPGSAIRVELTERSLLTTSPLVRESLERLRTLGIDVGLDDFGTGYSALAYLQRFALQFLKIDRSFVSRLGTSTRDDAVVAAVIDLAHAHELVVVAEGVETAEQLDALRTMGCDRAPGYLLGRPMRPADLEALLRTDPRW
jgi:diguanylate cyclase (GGDEF)-like protein/PAS domain S-box-containing protein